MRVDKAVHPACVGLQLRQLVRRQVVYGAVRGGPHLHDALAAVVLHQRGPEHLRQLARPVPAQRVHLPQPVAGGDVALRKQQILEIAGDEGGYALRIACDRHRRLQAGDGHLTVQRGQGGTGGMAQHQHPAQQ